MEQMGKREEAVAHIHQKRRTGGTTGDEQVCTRAGHATASPPGCAHADANIDAIAPLVVEESYWARGISRAVVEKNPSRIPSLQLVCGRDLQASARVVTDRATVYLGDVFCAAALSWPGLSSGWSNACSRTRDGRADSCWPPLTHGLYAQYGFTPMKAPQKWMEIPCAGRVRREWLTNSKHWRAV